MVMEAVVLPAPLHPAMIYKCLATLQTYGAKIIIKIGKTINRFTFLSHSDS